MADHANDIAYRMRQALLERGMSVTPVEVIEQGPPEAGWPNRDGTQQFEAVHSNSFNRGFRVTVEVVNADEVWCADGLEHQDVGMP